MDAQPSTCLTLIAPGGLGEAHRAAARRAIGAAGATLAGTDAFDPPWAERWQVSALPSSALRPALEAALWPLGADVVVHPRPPAPPRLLVADMDSTMIGQECIDELAALAGRGEEVAAITEAAMRGELDFAASLERRVAALAGLPAGLVDELLRHRIRPSPGAATLVATLKAEGARTLLVSGGFEAFTGPVAAGLGFDGHRANRLVVDEGRLAGRVEPPILGAAAKAAILEEERARLGLARDEVLAVGDGANDIPMLRAAGLGLAWRARPAARAAADAALAHADLSAVLWAAGIPRRAWLSR